MESFVVLRGIGGGDFMPRCGFGTSCETKLLSAMRLNFGNPFFVSFRLDSHASASEYAALYGIFGHFHATASALRTAVWTSPATRELQTVAEIG